MIVFISGLLITAAIVVVMTYNGIFEDKDKDGIPDKVEKTVKETVEKAKKVVKKKTKKKEKS